MKGQRYRVNSRKYDLTLNRTWECELVSRSPTRLELVGVFDSTVNHESLGTILAGTKSFETYFPDRWYNYFTFYEPSGDFRNYYFNITRPPAIGNNVVDYIDLDIDVVVWPTGDAEVLDRVDFTLNSAKYNYPHDVINSALSTTKRIETIIGRDRELWAEIL